MLINYVLGYKLGTRIYCVREIKAYIISFILISLCALCVIPVPTDYAKSALLSVKSAVSLVLKTTSAFTNNQIN